MRKGLLVLAVLFLAPAAALAISAEDYYNAGLSLYNQKDYAKAIEYFHAAVNDRPEFWQAYQYMGQAYFQQANRTEAVVCMRASLGIHPDNPDLKKFLANVESGVPWVVTGSWRDVVLLISLVFSALALGLTLHHQIPFFHRKPKGDPGRTP